jgi:hypothetical protein
MNRLSGHTYPTERVFRLVGHDDAESRLMEESVRIDRRALAKASRAWLAHKMKCGYFFLQPSLPPCEVMVVRAASVVMTLARPATLTCLFFPSTPTFTVNRFFDLP